MTPLRHTAERFAPWLLLLLIVLLWQAICSIFAVSEFIFLSPLAIGDAIVGYAGPIAGRAWRTYWVTMAGFNALPKAAFVPILVVWFGIGAGPAILTAFLIAFFPIMVKIATGLATMEPEMEDVLRVPGARRIDVLLKVGLPRSMPYFFASLKVAITLAFVGSTISEMNASNEGIGYLLVSAGSSMKMPLAFAGLVVIGAMAMAMAMYELFAVIERRTTGWAHRGNNSK